MANASTPQAPDAEIAELRRANAALQQERDASLAREAAMAEVLGAINRFPGDLGPVFDAILEKGMRLCGAAFGALILFRGRDILTAAMRNVPEAYRAWRVGQTDVVAPGGPAERMIESGNVLHILDMRTEPTYGSDPGVTSLADLADARTVVAVPLLKDALVAGCIYIFRQEVRAFSDREIALLENFAAQAVIAMENARLLTEQQEALERQTATAEVLQVINASPGNLAPVFDAILEKAHLLCDAPQGSLEIYDGQWLRAVAVRGFTEEVAATLRNGRRLEEVTDLHMYRVNQIADQTERLAEFPDDPALRAAVEVGRTRTRLSVPLVKDGAFLGRILAGRQEVRAFTGKQISLLENFAAQAVIAMENARLLSELQARTAELAARNSAFSEQIEHQSATIDVLKAMSASPGDPQPVFDLIAVRARDVCQAYGVTLYEYDGALMHWRANTGLSDDPAVVERFRAQFPAPPTPATIFGRAILNRDMVHIRDNASDPQIDQARRAGVGARSSVAVPLLRDGVVTGALVMGSRALGGFSDSQVQLLQTFTEQAVIAIRSAETFRELEARTAALAQRNSEFAVQVAHQAATIDVLKVMSASTNDTAPVFDIIVRRAIELAGAASGSLFELDGGLLHLRKTLGHDPEAVALWAASFPQRPNPRTPRGRAVIEGKAQHDRSYQTSLDPSDTTRGLGTNTIIAVPLLRDGVPIGAITVSDKNVDRFNDAHIALLETFAEQAVIAIGSVATFRELQERTAELTRSVAELQALEEVLRAVNSSLDLETVLATIIERAVPLAEADEGTIYEFDTAEQVFVPKAAFGMTDERITRLRERRIRIGETFLGRSARERVAVAVDDVQQDPSIHGVAEVLAGIHAVLAVPLLREDAVVGGLVIRRRTEGAFAPATVTLMQTFAAQSVLAIENARLFEAARRARAAAEVALADLRRAQDRLVQTEKMASLGQLTAGIAHEIKNPLNFVNNFSELSTELIDELQEALAPAPIDKKLRSEIDDLTGLLKSNLEKVVQHGKRADGIVKNMLLHSRESGGEMRSVEVNGIVEEALNLAYHGARAEKPGFNISLVREFDPAVGTLELYPQEFTRVLLNLIANGFYAATRKKAETGDPGFEPTLSVATEARPGEVAIRIRDNGTGIPEHVRAKMFEPFFTTKPAGEGTGLGLSLSHDIVVKQHGGSIAVDTRVGAFTEFTVTLPRPAA